ncbi:TPA: zinc ribbon domain-containing protein [Providencia alcalifaciens]
MSIFSWLFNLGRNRYDSKRDSQYRGYSGHGSNSKHGSRGKHGSRDKQGYGSKHGGDYQCNDGQGEDNYFSQGQNIQKIRCRQCQRAVDPNANFCGECGAST